MYHGKDNGKIKLEKVIEQCLKSFNFTNPQSYRINSYGNNIKSTGYLHVLNDQFLNRTHLFKKSGSGSMRNYMCITQYSYVFIATNKLEMQNDKAVQD